jgi:hypothetical protein
MGDIAYGFCQYCKDRGPLRITYFSFPIQCECCSPNHSLRIEHCSKCEAIMPAETRVYLSTKKLQDPIHEGLLTNGAFYENSLGA